MAESRSPTFEREWIAEALRHAGVWDQTRQATRISDRIYARLAKGAEEYGPDNFIARRDQTTRELSEEAADICAWALLRAQSLAVDGDEGMDGEAVQEIRARLLRASALAVQSWLEIEEARKLEREHRPPIGAA